MSFDRCKASVLLVAAVFGFSLPVLAQTTGEIAKGNCKAVSAACQKAVDYCNKKKGKFSDTSTLNALKDCIDACKATSSLLERNSALASKTVPVTISACEEAAKACDKFKGDNQMVQCANECRKAVGNLQKVQ